MRQRRKVQSETLIREEAEDGGDEEIKGFYACYLLVSLSPRHKGHTYIGFTVNPRRRIRQHNGEIGCGARHTKKMRPWEMVLCIYGFPTNIAALQFEWAWQHPTKSLAVREAAGNFKSRSGVANKIKLAYTMLALPSWQSLNITVNYFSTKYKQHSAGCPSLPEQMKVKVCPMDELPCYLKGNESLLESDHELDFEEDDEVSGASKSSQEASLDSVIDNSEDHPTGINKMSDELDGWIDKGDECRGQSSFTKSPEQAYSNLQLPTFEDHQNGIVTMSYDLYGWSEGEGDDDCREQSSFTDSVEKTSPNVSPSSVIAVDEDVRDNNFELDQPARKQRRTADKDQPPRSRNVVPSGVEIIDMTTPSPQCRSSFLGKRRKASSVYPEIIDLTRSPSFVRL
ncbi:hypothetical protein UlMin_012995 [Ulmus minor]